MARLAVYTTADTLADATDPTLADIAVPLTSGRDPQPMADLSDAKRLYVSLSISERILQIHVLSVSDYMTRVSY